MPPPRVSPPTPVEAMKPDGVAMPKPTVAWSTSPQVAPPSTRTVRAAGSTVVLRISKGPDLVEVPRVVGLSKEQAVERLRQAGLRPRFVFPVGSRVVEQSPAPGEKARRGSDVRLLLNLF